MTDRWTSPRRVALVAVGCLAVTYLIAPTLVVIPMGFSDTQTLQFPPRGFTLTWYERMLTDPAWSNRIVASLQVGVLTAITATVIGTAAALGIVRGQFPGKRYLAGLVVSPQIVPLVIIAIGMFAVFARWQLVGTLPGLVAAHTVLALPFVVVNVGASLRSVDPNFELAAMSLGATRLSTFRTITLPLITPGVAAGAIFAFITSWDDVVVALFLSTTNFRTLPAEMWQQLRQQVDPTVAAVSTTLLVVTTLMFAVALLVRRRSAT